MLTTLQWKNITSVISKWGAFLPFLSLLILFSALPSNFIFSGLKKLNMILLIISFSILLVDHQSVLHAFSGVKLGKESIFAKKNPSEARKKACCRWNCFWVLQINEHWYLLYIQWLIKSFADVKYVFEYTFSLIQTIN